MKRKIRVKITDVYLSNTAEENNFNEIISTCITTYVLVGGY